MRRNQAPPHLTRRPLDTLHIPLQLRRTPGWFPNSLCLRTKSSHKPSCGMQNVFFSHVLLCWPHVYTSLPMRVVSDSCIYTGFLCLYCRQTVLHKWLCRGGHKRPSVPLWALLAAKPPTTAAGIRNISTKSDFWLEIFSFLTNRCLQIPTDLPFRSVDIWVYINPARS